MKRRMWNWKRLLLSSALAGAMLVPAAGVHAQTIAIQPNDSLYLIGKRYGLTAEHLKIANHLVSDTIYAGSSLYIPPASTIYTILPGDSLWKLSVRFGTTIEKLMEINRLKSDLIYAGDRLLIPKTTGTAAKTTAAKPAASNTSAANTTVAKTAAAPAAAAKPWTEIKLHTVQDSDTPWTLSIKYGIPMEEFLRVNGMTESSWLMTGQKVKIPVHHIPVTATPGPQYGEYLDWFGAAQYLFPINAVATVQDFHTGKTFRVKRSYGAGHADCEPLTSADAAVIKQVWGGTYSWQTRPVLVRVNGRSIAASMASMPHSVETIKDNNFTGHFDIHFLNSVRHKDGLQDAAHQANVKVAAGRK